MDTLQHFFELINSHKNIFIIIPADPSEDAFFSAFALKKLCESYKKNCAQAKLVCENTAKFANLAITKQFSRHLTLKNQWEFNIDIAQTKIQSVKYDKTDTGLTITVVPENPKAKPGKYEFSNSAEENLIIALGMENKTAIPNFSEIEKTEELIINIDNQLKNSHFGKLYIVKENLTIAEIICQLFFHEIEKNTINQEALSALYSALISASNQFKNSKTTSDLLKKAAFLLEKGANLQKSFDYTA
ncbi:MAG: hypothetical protein V1698_00180 [bacterium]